MTRPNGTDNEQRAETDGGATLEWVAVGSSEDPRNRRYGRNALAALVPLLLLTVTSALLVGGAAAHTTFEANDVSTSSPSGNLQSLTVAPKGDVHYYGLESVPRNAYVVVEIREEGGTWETIGNESVGIADQSGSVNYSFGTIDVISSSSLAKSDFRAVADGSSATTTLEMRVEVTMLGVGGGGSDVTASASDTFDVTVTNVAAGGGIGGQSNGNAN